MIKLPLIVRLDMEAPYKMNCLVGKSLEEMEKVGELFAISNFRNWLYKTLETEKLKSFHINTFQNKEIIKKLKPGKEIQIGRYNWVGWGYDRPLVTYQPGRFGVIENER